MTGARRWAAVATCALLLACTACSSSGTAIRSPFATSAPSRQRGPVYLVKAADISGLGTVLVDGEGKTLYLFASDRRGSPSTCYGICAIQWPPLLLPPGRTAPSAGPGIDASLLGTAARRDGARQVTYNGWPLYLWPPDRAPGQATGQALTNAGGRWYVVDPAGDAVH